MSGSVWNNSEKEVREGFYPPMYNISVRSLMWKQIKIFSDESTFTIKANAWSSTKWLLSRNQLAYNYKPSTLNTFEGMVPVTGGMMNCWFVLADYDYCLIIVLVHFWSEKIYYDLAALSALTTSRHRMYKVGLRKTIKIEYKELTLRLPASVIHMPLSNHSYQLSVALF